MKYDEFFLARAFELARRGRFTTTPNPNVGCVIARDGHILGEGYHRRAGEPHAEICALHKSVGTVRGSTAYITLEPCSHYGRVPPCTDALIKAGIVRVVAAISDPNPKVSGRGFYQLEQAGINVRQNLMIKEAELLNQGFLKRMRTGLPWIRLKLAASLDGRIAISSGKSKWISSLEARRDVQRWRAESDAILSTANTVIKDNPSMTVRWESLPLDIQNLYPKNQIRQPIRVIIDSNNHVMPSHRIIHEEGQTWLVRLHPDNLLWPKSVKQVKISAHKGLNSIHIDLMVLMMYLGQHQINNLFVEAGASLSSALLSAGLIDELILYQAPKILGADSYPLFLFSGFKQLNKVPQFKLLDIRQVGPDIRMHLKPIKNV